MAEIDWDEIIKAAKSKKKEKKGDKDLEKRLDRMEKLLEKAVDAKAGDERARASKPEEAAEKVEEVEARPERKEAESKKSKLEKAGFKFVKVPKVKRLRISRPKTKIKIPKMKLDLSDRKNVIALIVVIGIVLVVALQVTGNLNFEFTGFTTQQKTMYVCADGVTTVENTTMCPATTTTTAPTTTTTSTTTTTTIPTTTTTMGPKHSIGITESSCSGKIISLKMKNTGPDVNNLLYVTFFVDGEKENTFLCTGGVLGPGEETVCLSGMMSTGTHEVEARGLVNIAYATVRC